MPRSLGVPNDILGLVWWAPVTREAPANGTSSQIVRACASLLAPRSRIQMHLVPNARITKKYASVLMQIVSTVSMRWDRRSPNVPIDRTCSSLWSVVSYLHATHHLLRLRLHCGHPLVPDRGHPWPHGECRRDRVWNDQSTLHRSARSGNRWPSVLPRRT